MRTVGGGRGVGVLFFCDRLAIVSVMTQYESESIRVWLPAE